MLEKNFLKFANFAKLTLIYLIAVILFGAWVRTSLSGAGCGDHWPLCNGNILPLNSSTKTWVEFSHRISSGLSGLLVLILMIFGFKFFPKKHVGRFFSVGAFIFILLEGAIGALLVKRGLVTTNPSLERAIVTALHLINTQILLGFLTGIIFFSKRENFGSIIDMIPKGLSLILGLLLLVSASGAIVALGDLIFPALNLTEGIKQDFAETSHWLIRLRLIHPILAIGTALMVFIFSLKRPDEFGKLKSILSWVVFIQLVAGLLNVILLAPSWMQIVHLGVACFLWILIIWLWFSEATLKNQASKAHVHL